MLASFGQIEYVIFGIVAAVAIYIGRIIITHTALVRGFSKLDKKVTSVMIPRGLAAAALYLSCVKNGEDKTQRDIAEAANVTEVTIRNRYKGLKESIDV